jgi:site-specific DNA recombinase
VPAPLANSANIDQQLPVALWLRVSTEEQAAFGTAGLARQSDQVNRIVAARNYRVVASFSVIGVSGASVQSSHEFVELMGLVTNDKIGAVVCSETSRLMRVDSWQSMAILDVFAKKRVLIVADGVEMDVSNPDGFLTGGIQTLLAGHERLKLVQKIQAAKQALRRQGKCPTAAHTIPFAVRYARDTGKFSYDPADVQKVQEAFRLIDEEGLYNIAEVARRAGFKRTGLRVILQNPIYVGIRRYDTRSNPDVKRIGPDGRKTYRPKQKLPPDEVLEIKVLDEPAVNPARWERVQSVLGELRTNHLARLPKEALIHACTGLGRCGMCGLKLYLSGNGKRHKATGERVLWYCCRSGHPGRKHGLPRCSNGWVSKPKLDALIYAFCQTVLTDAKFLASIITASVERSSEVVRPFPQQGFREAIAKAQRKEKRLIEMCAADAISIQTLKAERAVIGAEIERLRGLSATAPEKQPATATDLSRLIVKAVVRFRTMTDERERKAVLEQVFAEVFFRMGRESGESITAFRLHPHLVACMGEAGKEFAQTIHLEKAFRTTPELPPGHAPCSKCGTVLPRKSFPPGRLMCVPCFRDYNHARLQKYRGKKRERKAV